MSTKMMSTVAEIAKRWGCCHSTVLTLVYLGELRAIDISTNPKGKSRYIVPVEEVERFEAARTVPPPEPAPKPKRVRVRPGEVIQFFS